MKASAAAGLAALLAALPASAGEETYLAVSRGARCGLQADGSLTCRYRVGAGLEFVLHRVGEPAVRLEVLREQPDGDYRLDPVRHGTCLFVRDAGPAPAAGNPARRYAVVSTVNGAVYRGLGRCSAAR
jgi:hypothetical protein